MALTPAEKQKRYRERQKQLAAEQAKNLADVAPDGFYLKQTFGDFIADKFPLFDENLDAFGVQIDGRLDSEPQRFQSEYERDEPLTALQRAMGLVDVFIDAAQELSHLINVYKLQEIARAINEAERQSANLPRGDVAALKASFTRIERLKAIQTDLRRPTRQTFLAIRSKGE